MATKRRCRSISAPFGYYCSQMQCRLHLLTGNGAIKRAVRRMSDENFYRVPIQGTTYGGIPIRSAKSEPSHSSSVLEKSSSSRSSKSSHNFHLPSSTETHRSFQLKQSTSPIVHLPRVRAHKSGEIATLTEEELRYLYPNTKIKDLYFINIQGLYFSKVDKYLKNVCVNVIAIDAGENYLELEYFRYFPNLKELHLPLNNIKQINIKENDFQALTVLDLSCNYISPTAIFLLSHLSNLKMLDLSCNNLQYLPIGLQQASYSGLDTLILDHNLISDPINFKSLSRLQRLRTLSLKNNDITHLPFIETKRTQNLMKLQMEELMANENSLMGKSPMQGPLGDSFPTTLKHSLKKSSSVKTKFKKYILDEKNLVFPFPQLQQLNLANNKIKEVNAVYAIKTWAKMKELVIVGNRIDSLSSRHLIKIREYLVPSFSTNYAELSYRIYDTRLDPFHKEGLLGKFLCSFTRDEEFCSCHEKTSYQHEEIKFNMDARSSTPIAGMQSLPLPNQRLCKFNLLSQTQSCSRRKKLKLPIESAAFIAQTWRNIGDHLAPSTLPSTIKATKIALQKALLQEHTLRNIKTPLIVQSTSTSSSKESDPIMENLRKQLLTKFKKP